MYLNVRALVMACYGVHYDCGGRHVNFLISRHHLHPHSPLFNSLVLRPGQDTTQDGKPVPAHTACPVVADGCELLQHVSKIHTSRPSHASRALQSLAPGEGVNN